MKLVKSLLLGSAAGLCAVAGAQAADLPVRKAAPVEYVRVCTAFGAGFFYIPGTDTCIRVGGRARFEYQYTSQRARQSDNSGYRGLARLNLDSRTQTAYGTLRAFIRLEIASRTGGYLTSGTQQRYGNAFTSTGIDEVGRNQKYVEVDKAFVQFAGFTAGRASSFFDFYAHDLEFIGSSIGSDVSSTNLLAYTATFGQGWSATLSVEDPTFRRNPVSNGGFGAGTFNYANAAATTFIAVGPLNANGTPIATTTLNVQQINNMPDVVGAVRYDAPWGAAQVSAAAHELRTGSYASAATVGGLAVSPVIPKAQYGYAVQGGLKINMPQVAPGDVLWLQAAYAEGAGSYTGIFLPQGQEANSNIYTNRSNFSGFDMAYDTNGRAHLTKSWSGTLGYLHYWSPEWRQGAWASYGRAEFDNALRGPASPNVGAFFGAVGGPLPTVAGAGAALGGQGVFNPYAKSYSNLYIGSNLIWSPVRDLDIGVEGVYEKLEFIGKGVNGRAFDLNKGGVNNLRTMKGDDNALVRIRVQRDF